MTFDVHGFSESGPVRLSSLSVAVSGDDGTRWVSARSVERIDDDTYRVTVRNPRTAGPVGLRITANARGSLKAEHTLSAAYWVG